MPPEANAVVTSDTGLGQTTVSDDSGQTSSADAPQDWRSLLPEGFADAPFIKAAPDPTAALTAIQNAASHMGNSIRIPGEDAGKEDIQKFYSKILEKAPNLMPKPDADNIEQVWAALGRPDKPDGYTFTPPEGKEIPPDMEAFASVAHKYGLSQDQFKGILGDVLNNQWAEAEAIQSRQNDEMAALNKEWGIAYDKHMSQVKNFLKLSDAPEGIVDLITEGAMSADEIKWLHSIANQTKSQAELSQQTDTAPDVVTPAEARDRIAEMLNNSEHPYWNNTDPRHNDAVRKMLELQALANPEAA